LFYPKLNLEAESIFIIPMYKFFEESPLLETTEIYTTPQFPKYRGVAHLLKTKTPRFPNQGVVTRWYFGNPGVVLLFV